MKKEILTQSCDIPSMLPGMESEGLPIKINYNNQQLVFPYLKFDVLTYYHTIWFNDIIQITYSDRYNKETKEKLINEVAKKIWLHEKMTGGRLNATGQRDPKKHRRDLDFDKMLRKCFDDCEECDIKLNYHFKYNRFYYERLNYGRPSLDRIDSDYGYTTNNTRVVCLDCNTEKKDKEGYKLNKIK